MNTIHLREREKTRNAYGKKEDKEKRRRRGRMVEFAFFFNGLCTVILELNVAPLKTFLIQLSIKYY